MGVLVSDPPNPPPKALHVVMSALSPNQRKMRTHSKTDGHGKRFDNKPPPHPPHHHTPAHKQHPPKTSTKQTPTHTNPQTTPPKTPTNPHIMKTPLKIRPQTTPPKTPTKQTPTPTHPPTKPTGEVGRHDFLHREAVDLGQILLDLRLVHARAHAEDRLVGPGLRRGCLLG